MVPHKNPISNSLFECAFISSRDEATSPFMQIKKATKFMVLISLWMLNPIMKTVIELIPIMWILALVFRYNKKKAETVLNIPPIKKKYKLGKRSKVMLFSISTAKSMICKSNGILRWEISESIIVSTFPNVLRRKKKVTGNKIVMMVICKNRTKYCGSVK